MIGGIYLEIPLGSIYNEHKRYAVRENANRILGLRANFLKKEVLDKMLVDKIYKIAKNDISRHRGDVRREHLNRSVDLMRSTCMGVFLDGHWDGRLYRFTGGSSEAEPLVEHDDDPAERAEAFMKSYKLHQQSRFTVVIAATMPYAVRVEASWGTQSGQTMKYPGYALAVLKFGITRIAGKILSVRPKSVVSDAMYGYIFERGGEKLVKKV